MREMGIDPALERAADELLKEDAKTQRYIRKTGRGLSKYLRENGMLTKKDQEKLRQMEIQGLDMESRFRTPGERHSKRMEEDD